jgi:hypothetical protein
MPFSITEKRNHKFKNQPPRQPHHLRSPFEHPWITILAPIYETKPNPGSKSLLLLCWLHRRLHIDPQNPVQSQATPSYALCNSRLSSKFCRGRHSKIPYTAFGGCIYISIYPSLVCFRTFPVLPWMKWTLSSENSGTGREHELASTGLRINAN